MLSRYRIILKMCFIFMVLIISGCSNNLSRGKAESLIKSNAGPIKAIVVLINFGFGVVHSDGMAIDYSDFVKRGYLSDKGLLTDKGRKSAKVTAKYTYEFPLALPDKIKVIEITQPADAMGIKMCIANCEITYKPTELGNDLGLKEETRKYSAQFVKMDNGWKLDTLQKANMN